MPDTVNMFFNGEPIGTGSSNGSIIVDERTQPNSPAAKMSRLASRIDAVVPMQRRFEALRAPERFGVRAEQPNPKVADGVATIRLYDAIDSFGGDWGVSAKEFVDVLDSLDVNVTEIRLLVNSPGGEVWQGLAILNALRAHKARVVAVVEGIAASAASFIAAGVDELVMAPNSELFIHNAWGLVVGNADDMRKMADELTHEDRNLASIYAKKAGGTVDEWLARMTAETWFSADEAVAAGLADRVDGEPASNEAKNRFDLSIFKNSRREPGTQASAPPPSPSPEPGQEGGSMPDLTELRDALGLAEDTADDDVLVAALDKLTAPPPEPDPAPLPDGVVAIDAAQLDQLRADAQAGRDARAEQLRAERAQTVDAAVRDGRIPPARRDHWVAQLEADPEAAKVLAELKPGLVPVNGAVGSNGVADLDSDDAIYAELFGTKEVAR